MTESASHVLIIGGGFGGLAAARECARSSRVRVTLIDKCNYHLFQPLLYQVATAALSPAEVAYPIRRIFRRARNVTVYLAEALDIDLAGRLALTSSGPIRYDYLVVAAGSVTSYFGHDDWKRMSPGLKTIEDALLLRKKILLAFEEAENLTDEASRKKKLTFVIVGGGPTGVELAGALREIAVESLRQDFRNINTSSARIVLLDAAPRILHTMPGKASHYAMSSLERMGVEVYVNCPVSSVFEGGVQTPKGAFISENIFWTAGVSVSPLAGKLLSPLLRDGRVDVLPDLSIPSHPEVFVIGDMAGFEDRTSGAFLPGLAPVAIQEGQFVGSIIASETENPGEASARPEFKYKDKGMLATIGRGRAVARIRGSLFTGLTAWLLWCLVHIYSLIGFRNRLLVMLSWLWRYISFGLGARLITWQEKPDARE